MTRIPEAEDKASKTSSFMTVVWEGKFRLLNTNALIKHITSLNNWEKFSTVASKFHLFSLDLEY